MLEFLKLNLQLFADGGDGGASAGEGAEGGTSGETASEMDAEMARIPERARKRYAEALAKTKGQVETNKTEDVPSQPTSDNEEAEQPTHIAFTDLIKSDEYKAEHKAYMDKVIGDRLKGVKAENESMKQMLSIVANKYGLDPSAEKFNEVLKQKIDSDNSFYEEYAMEHNISAEDARDILTARQQIRVQEQQRQAAEEEAKNREAWNALVEKGKATKAKYSEFDLMTELQNPRFKQICIATQGDTTAAYEAVHHDELMKRVGLQASQKASQQIANSVASNMQRPTENGLSSQASSVTQVDWRRANLQQIRAFADEQRRLQKK